MLFRFLVAHNHPKLPDVPPHFHADVCSQLIFDLLLVDGFTRSDAKCRRERVQILFRCASFGLPAAHPVKHQPAFLYFLHSPPRPPQTSAASFKSRYRKSAAICIRFFTPTGVRRGFPINANDFSEVDGWPNRTSRLVVISHQGFTSSDAKD